MGQSGRGRLREGKVKKEARKEGGRGKRGKDGGFAVATESLHPI